MIGKIIRNFFRLSCLYVSLQGINYTNLVTKYSPQPNQYSRFGGNYRQAGYCLLSLILTNILLLILSETFLKENNKFRSFSGALFTDVTRPLCFIYTFIIWSFSIFGSRLLVHWNQTRWTPKWYNHSLYTFPLFFAFIESFVQSHSTKGFKNSFNKSISVILLYIIWQGCLMFVEGRDPNRVFGLIWWKQLLFFVLIVAFEFIFVGFGYLIDWALFDLPEINHVPNSNHVIESPAENKETSNGNNREVESETEYEEESLIELETESSDQSEIEKKIK
jgi:hypothetical protein